MERRRHYRVEARLPGASLVLGNVLAGVTNFTTETLDLSEGGAKIRVPDGVGKEGAGCSGELGYPTDPDATTGRLDSLLSRQDYAVFIAEQDQRAIGMGSVHVLPLLHADSLLGLITALVVSGVARGDGVGRQLVRQIETFARTQGCTLPMEGVPGN